MRRSSLVVIAVLLSPLLRGARADELEQCLTRCMDLPPGLPASSLADICERTLAGAAPRDATERARTDERLDAALAKALESDLKLSEADEKRWVLDATLVAYELLVDAIPEAPGLPMDAAKAVAKAPTAIAKIALDHNDRLQLAADLEKITGAIKKNQDVARALVEKYHDLSRTMAEAQAAHAEALSNLGDRLTQRLADDRKVIDANIRKVEERTRALEGRVDKNERDIAENRALIQENQRIIQAHSRDIGAMKSALYSRLTPGEKLDWNRQGVVKLTPSEVKSLKVQEVCDKVGTYCQVATQVVGTLSALGLSDKFASRANKAIGAVAAGAQLAMGIASGNPLAAISGAMSLATTLFGKQRPDPASARHEQVLSALGVISGKLDTVIELQVRTLETLGRIETKLDELRRLVLESHAQTLRAIDELRIDVLTSRDFLLDAERARLRPLTRVTSNARDLESFAEFLANEPPTAFGQAVAVCDDILLDKLPSGFRLSAVHDAASMQRTESFRSYRDRVLRPALGLVPERLDLSVLRRVLARPKTTPADAMQAWSVAAVTTEQGPAPSSLSGDVGEVLAGALRPEHVDRCWLNAEAVREFAAAVLGLIPLCYLVDARNGEVRDAEQINAKFIALIGSRTTRWLSNLIVLLEVSCAQQSILGGDLFLAPLVRGPSDAHLSPLVGENRLLEANFALAWTGQVLSVRPGGSVSPSPWRSHLYELAYGQASVPDAIAQQQPERRVPLAELLSLPIGGIGMDPVRGGLRARLSGDGEVWFRLPLPEELSQGELHRTMLLGELQDLLERARALDAQVGATPGPLPTFTRALEVKNAMLRVIARQRR